MRRAIAAILVVVTASAPILAGSKRDLDEKNGFRDVTFEDELSKYPTMTPSQESGENHFYKREDDVLSFGGIELTSISYVFYKDRLAKVLLMSKGISACAQLRSIMESAYGAPFKPNRFMDDYWWIGKRVTLRVKINEVAHDCHALFISNALSDREEADKKQAAEDAKKDLLK